MSIVENERNAMMFTTARLVFISIPLFWYWLKLYYSFCNPFIPLLLWLRLQRAMPQCPFLHQHEEHRNQNQYVNRGRNHSAAHGSGNRLHHVRADTTRPEDGNQAGENGGDRHQLGAEPMDSTLNGGLLNVGLCKRVA